MIQSSSNNRTSKLYVPKLYLITNNDSFDVLYKKLSLALATGVVSQLQIRRKKVQQLAALQQEVTAICELADEYNCRVIINDDMRLAHQFGLGVHLGQDDGTVAQARTLLGDKATIGSTCYGSVDLVNDAITSGASYAAMGAVFSSATKPEANIAALEALQQGSQLCHKAGIDFCVIGGITSQNISQLQGLAVDYFAVVNDILGEDISSVETKCQLWQQALHDYKA